MAHIPFKHSRNVSGDVERDIVQCVEVQGQVLVKLPLVALLSGR